MTTLKSNLLKKSKKGFTLTELAIVIAVIAILIAVLVPTFTSVITSARKTSALSNAKNAITEYAVEYQGYPDDGAVIVDGSDYYVVYDSTAEDSYTAVAVDEYSTKYPDGVTIAAATLLYTAVDGKVDIYGTDASNTTITETVKAAIEANITTAIESVDSISTYATGYTCYATDGYYWWTVTITESTTASTGAQLAKVALATEDTDDDTSTTSYVVTLTDVDTDAESWTEPTVGNDDVVLPLKSESATIGYLYAIKDTTTDSGADADGTEEETEEETA